MSKSTIGKIIILGVLSIAMVLAFVAMFSALGLMNEEGFKNTDLIKAGTTSATKASFWMNMGLSLGLLGCVVAIIMKMIGKDEIAPFIFIAAGVIAMICIFVSMGMNSENMDALKSDINIAKLAGKAMEKAATGAYNREIFVPLLNILVFGGMPVAYGVKGLLNK